MLNDTTFFPAALLLVQTTLPNFATPVAFILLVAGATAALVATILGFSRAQAFGASTRWFAMSALCLLIYHLQFVLLIFFAFNDARQNDFTTSFGFYSFFNLFVALAGVCAIMGFVRLTDSR